MKKEIIPKESVISCHLRTNHYFTQKLLVKIILCSRYREALFSFPRSTPSPKKNLEPLGKCWVDAKKVLTNAPSRSFDEEINFIFGNFSNF